MTVVVNQLIEWESTDGSLKSLIIVTDSSVPENEVGHEKIEVCEYDKSEEEWKTIDTLDYIDEIESFGIPQSFVD